ncbi:PLD nuclease N-terminal domain-containing protein [Streptomyces sp. 796.1]|uniref:PLD nuclease N-terminal domain-containing protein n=1 Tax=Streptomyces sp. 796.1 TaxID=3163029 RepID=UPI0039C9066C
MLRYLPFLLVLALWIYAFIDCLNTPEEEVRKLPKVAWVIIVLLFGEVLIGPVAWLTVGRPRKAHAGGGAGGGAGRGGFGGSFGGRRGGGGWVAPDDNPEFLKSLRKENGPTGRPAPDPDAPTDDDTAPGSTSGTTGTSGSGASGSSAAGPGGSGSSASGSSTGDRKPEADRREDEGPEGTQRG